MKINTARLGEVEINEEDILTFEDGLIGFSEFTKCIELKMMEDSPIKLLQSLDNQNLAFFVVDPRLFAPEYIVDITKEQVESVGAKTINEMEVRAIVTIPDNPYEMTANLQGPLVICKKSCLARQIVNHNQDYTTKHRMLTDQQKGLALQ